jgi:hypothetical protein
MIYWHFPCGEDKNILENSSKFYVDLEFGAFSMAKSLFPVGTSAELYLVHYTRMLFGEPLTIS